MACNNCSSDGGVPKGCQSNGSCGTGGCNKLPVFDWLSNMELPSTEKPFDWVEIRFKNGRKEFYHNANELTLQVGDAVATEAPSGHDIGNVSIVGELVKLQMNKKKFHFDKEEKPEKVYRKASEKDLESWAEARNKEQDTMIQSRVVAGRLGLKMKISDVEYQGDGSKATFFYTAEERVDFRLLIRELAQMFSVRIDMRQIGARQEAQRLGGIGSCGRELCCSTWLSDFRSVNTAAARYQQLSLNPQKLAGQCGKLKCCLNYELDSYMEAVKRFPSPNKKLKLSKGVAVFQKMDIFKEMLWYSLDSDISSWVPLKLDQVNEIIEANDKGEIPDDLSEFAYEEAPKVKAEFEVADFVGGNAEESINRFDKPKKQSNKGNRNRNRNRNRANKPQKKAE
ncbi:MAG: regulatory iron-sulfur-containing complex subunit RicT [Flavobacteriales bacterium]|jgi:cell fate regulator YaaT (PSP1 superfamily)|tara:strand:- start:993 stop:2180 length:1188 start_codon:yes stop_codon:yes gene_type:complete